MSHRFHHGPLAAPHTEIPLEAWDRVCLLALAALALLALLGGCAGSGPLGTGLGTVVGDIAVTDGKGNTCNVTLKNGKDQTNLELEGLHVCGASIDKLHADRSDGAQAAINANADVTKTLGGQLIGLLGSAVSLLAPVPVPHAPPPPAHPVPPVVVPPVVVPPPPPAFPGALRPSAAVSPLQEYLASRTAPAPLESPEP